MLRNLHDLNDYTIRAADGDIGHVKDFYIDDQAWVIRYFVVETGSWLSSRKVLVSPIAVGELDWQEKSLPVSVTRKQVENSPDIDTDKPVSRQHENQYIAYYSYFPYWAGPGLWGAGTHPNLMMPQFVSTPSVIQPQPDHADVDDSTTLLDNYDTHLRSCNVVMDYYVHASDGEIGHVQAMLVDDETWAIRYLVVNTSNWWLGHQVLIAPDWIHAVSWSDETVSLTITRQQVKDAPPYDPSIPVDRTHEISVYKHYGNMAYWAKEQIPDVPRADDKK